MANPATTFVWVCGMTCTGKTTLSKLLRNTLRCDIILVGEILRTEYSPQRISSGDINDEEFFQHIQKKINQRVTNLVIIDNFPTNWAQYNTWLKYYPTPNLILHIKSENVWQRKFSRGRLDDNCIDSMARYIKFQNYTIPVIDFLKAHFLVVEIDGDQTPRKLLEESINLIHKTLVREQTPFYDFSTPITFQRLSQSTKPLVRKEPFRNGCDVFLPESIIIAPLQTERHSTLISVEIGVRATGLVFGSLGSTGILVHTTTIDPGATELKITLSNLTTSPILIDADFPVAQILILPTLLPRFIETETINYGFKHF